RAWAFILGVFVTSRLLYLLVGEYAARAVAEPKGVHYLRLPPHTPLGQWANWDGAWYARIASQGYDLQHLQGASFFPLYPLLVRLATPSLDEVAARGVLVSLASLLAAFAFIYWLVVHGWGEPVARRTLLCLAFFPT